jgi:hypothetical protein
MPNIWVLHKPSKKTSQHFMLQMWVLQNWVNKTKVYFVTFMQVFHIELHVYGSSFNAIMQYYNMFHTCFWKKKKQSINAMLTFKACKHNTSVRLQLQSNKPCMY